MNDRPAAYQYITSQLSTFKDATVGQEQEPLKGKISQLERQQQVLKKGICI